MESRLFGSAIVSGAAALAFIVLGWVSSCVAQDSAWIARNIDNSYPGGYWSQDNVWRRYRRVQRYISRQRDMQLRSEVRAYVEREPERRYYAAPRDDERWERDERERCLDRKRVVGTEHATVDGALSAAKRQWMSLVRWDHGEKYMNIDISLHYQQRCERSSTNETAAGRVAEGLTGSFYTRCEVVAAPCVARRVRPEDNDRR